MKTDRRKLIKALTLGGGAVTVAKLPSTWSTPVVDSVALPAHAQTTIGPVLSGGSSITLNDGEGSPFNRFASRPEQVNPLLDRLIATAHAQPEFGMTSTEFRAYAERDLASGDGWWLLQVLVRFDIFSGRYIMLDASSESPGTLLGGLVSEAQAGGFPMEGEFEPEFPEPCVSEILWQTSLFVGLPDGDGFQSGWKSNLSPRDRCGDLGRSKDGPDPENPEVDLRIEDVNDPNNASSARVIVRESGGGSIIARIRLTPGGSRLSVNCGANACRFDPA